MIEKNRIEILTFRIKNHYEDPLDCIIKATFKGPNTTIMREAYWDGDNIYRISFAPDEIGLWQYTIEAGKDTGLDGLSGEIECIEYQGNLDIYKHGFLKVSDDKRYFTYHDGTPFFWLGDTHWEFSYREKWDESNHPKLTSMFKGMIDTRKAQGYTVYQTNLRSDPIMGGDKYYWDGNKPNIAFYQDELDRRMQYLADAGIVNAIGFAWFMSIDGNELKYQRLARYFIARYGAYPLVYTIAGELGGYDPDNKLHNVDAWRSIIDIVRKYDGYHHPLTVHYPNERPFAQYYQDEPWMDFTLNQAGHGDHVISVDDYKAFLNKHHDKPFVEGEAMYEFCSTLEENGTRLCTDYMMRRVAYLSIQAGGCGYTYGAQGIWDCYYEKGDFNPMKTFNRYDIPWYEAIDGIGGKQMGYMKQFYLDQEFWSLYPYQAKNGSKNDPFGKKMPLITISKEKDHLVLYYPESVRKSGTLELLNGNYEMCWFDPKSGQYQDPIKFTITDHKWIIPTKPDESDWCLVVEEIDNGKD